MRNVGPASLTNVPGSEQSTWGGLRDISFAIGAEVGGLAGRLSPATTTAIGDLVRGMNCYYSNLIEGHDTRPIDIDRALRDKFAGDAKRRNLQLEAVAHIGVQAAIDAGELDHLVTPSTLCAMRETATCWSWPSQAKQISWSRPTWRTSRCPTSSRLAMVLASGSTCIPAGPP